MEWATLVDADYYPIFRVYNGNLRNNPLVGTYESEENFNTIFNIGASICDYPFGEAFDRAFRLRAKSEGEHLRMKQTKGGGNGRTHFVSKPLEIVGIHDQSPDNSTKHTVRAHVQNVTVH